MKPKSLCFTGEAGLPCLSRLQVQLPIKASTCYREKVELFTNSRGGRKEEGRERERESLEGRGKRRRQQDETLYIYIDYFFKVMSQARLTVNDQTHGLILKENVFIPTVKITYRHEM